MKRTSILAVALLALFVSACGGGTASSSATQSQAATTEPTPQPTETPEASEPESSDGTGSVGSDLLALVPDEINGLARTDVDLADNPMFAQALGGSGVDTGDIDYVISTWGEGDVTLSSMRIPGMERPAFEALAQSMAGFNAAGGSMETVTVGGKSVIHITGTGAPAAAYMYFKDDALFMVVSEDQDLADQVLSALP